MLKNQKWTIVLIVSAVVVVTASAFIGWKIVTKNNSLQASTTEVAGAVSLNPSQSASESISLEPKAAEQKNPNALSVDDSQSNSTNLGSGNKQQATSASGSASKEDFSQFEQYKDKNEIFFGDIVKGTGAEAVKDAQLAVTYKGYLTNGQVFDQSRPANNGQLQPLLFTLGGGQLIPGFEQGVAGMKVGGVRRVIIPPSLGYGANAQGSIPANSVLIFDITLTAAQ
jgi:FKBP-type peptidyl-prolyl cis-trans isomerase FkpA